MIQQNPWQFIKAASTPWVKWRLTSGTTSQNKAVRSENSMKPLSKHRIRQRQPGMVALFHQCAALVSHREPSTSKGAMRFADCQAGFSWSPIDRPPADLILLSSSGGRRLSVRFMMGLGQHRQTAPSLQAAIGCSRSNILHIRDEDTIILIILSAVLSPSLSLPLSLLWYIVVKKKKKKKKSSLSRRIDSIVLA